MCLERDRLRQGAPDWQEMITAENQGRSRAEDLMAILVHGSDAFFALLAERTGLPVADLVNQAQYPG